MNSEKRKGPTKIVKLDKAKVEIREIDNDQPVDPQLNILPQVIRIDRKFIDSITTIENNEEQLDIKYDTNETGFNEDINNCKNVMQESEIKIEPDYEIKVEYEDNEEDMLEYDDHVWNHSGENPPHVERTSADERASSELNKDINQKPAVLEESCLDCNLSFHTNKLLREHVLFYHQKKQFRCEKCKNLFSKHGLSLHKCYECNTCGKIILCKYQLRKHVSIHEKMPKVRSQTKIIKPKNTLQEHLSSHNKTCFDCNISFSTKILFREHILLDHQKKEFKCEKCAKYFSREKALLKHKCYECNICGKIMSHKFRFQRHLRIHITSDEKEKMSTKWNIYRPRFDCNYCSRSYTVKNTLKRHLENVHYGLKYVCPQCGKQYSTQRSCSNCTTLKEICPVCKKAYSTYSDLLRHVKCVHQSRILGCQGNNNATRARLNHSEFKNVILCLRCTERFSNINTWIQHLKSKSHKQKQNERFDLSCQICNKVFSRSTHRTTHMMDVHGITILENKIFHCNYCDKDFTERNDAVEHVKSETHKHNKPKFECKICKKKMSHVTTFKKHKCNKKGS